MIKAAIIGFGGIAKAAHMPGYARLEKEGKIKLVAVCDIDPKRFEGKMEINIGGSNTSVNNEVKKYNDWREMLKNEEIDMVDICLPTNLHAETAIEVLEMGYNVLSEKPMSLCYEDSARMCEVAEKNGKKLMIGQCLRFSNEYNYIKKVVEEKEFGKVLSATFRRLSTPPTWGWNNWFMDKNLSGGCLFDLHIHDIDIVRHIFGEPKTVACVSQDVYAGNDIVHSRLNYNNFSVLAIGDWSRKNMPFIADFSVAFEKATVELADGTITVYPRDDEAYEPEVEAIDMYGAEIEFFAKMLETDCENATNPPESAAKTIRLIEKLGESALENGMVLPFED